MADLTYQATLDDKISPALLKIQQQTKKTADTFGAFKQAIGAIAIGSLIQSALRYADAITDIADAAEMAVQNVIGFGKAVSAAGGTTEKAQAAMVKFNDTLGQAANGSLAAQDAFAQIGITLTDLRNLSNEDLFNLTIKRLGELNDVGQRTRLTNELLGKSLRGVNLKGLSGEYNKATAASVAYAAQVRKAAELQDKLDAAFSKVKLSILSTLEPLITWINSLDTDKVNQFIDAVVKIGAASVAIAGLVKVVEGLGKAFALLGGVFALYKSGILNVTAGATAAVAAVSSLGKTVQITGSVLGRYAIPAWLASTTWRQLGAEIALTFATLGKRIGFATAAFGGLGGAIAALVLGIGKIALAFAAVAAAVVGINELIKLAFDIDPIDAMATKLEELVTKWFPGLAAGINKVGAYLGMAKPPSESGSGGGRGDAKLHLELYKQQQEELAKQNAATEEKARLDREVQDALAKQRKEIQAISGEFRKQLDNKAEELQLETNLIGKSEQQKTLQQLLIDLTSKTTDEVDKLTKAKEGLSAAEKRAGLAAEYDKQINAVKQLGEAEKARLTDLVAGLSKAKALEEFRLFTVKEQQDAEDKLLAIQRQIADIGLTDIEKGYRDISRAADDSAKAAIRAEEARRGAPLNEDEIKKYYETARKGSESLLKAQQQLNKESRTFSAGWKTAFKSYVDNATNAAKAAERLFEKFTSGIEDLLVDFAKTGKFEWKNFVADMAEELLRSQIKQTMASVLQMPNPFGSGNVSDMFGGLFGGLLGDSGASKGQSANNPMYVFDVSGGSGGPLGGLMGPQQGGGSLISGGGIGGGLMGGIGKVASGIGGAISSVASGIGSVIGGISDTVGSIFGGGGDSGGGGFLDSITSGIGSLFDGWFANGGTIGAGKFGMVGERGPELVGGPATVTPLTGGTNVTYNINAVDAASFQAMIARDPGFIYGVSEAGRRSAAGIRR